MTNANYIMKIRKFITSPVAWAILVSILMLSAIHPYVVSGPSMRPAFTSNDRLLVERFSPKLGFLGRGEVIVFPDPRAEGNPITIKRIVGLPNETIRIRDGAVIIVHSDGKEEVLDEEWLGDGAHQNGEDMEMKLGPEDYFLMGDNRAESTDSRSWGTIQPSEMTGTPLVRLAPHFKLFP